MEDTRAYEGIHSTQLSRKETSGPDPQPPPLPGAPRARPLQGTLQTQVGPRAATMCCFTRRHAAVISDTDVTATDRCRAPSTAWATRPLGGRRTWGGGHQGRAHRSPKRAHQALVSSPGKQVGTGSMAAQLVSGKALEGAQMAGGNLQLRKPRRPGCGNSLLSQ